MGYFRFTHDYTLFLFSCVVFLPDIMLKASFCINGIISTTFVEFSANFSSMYFIIISVFSDMMTANWSSILKWNTGESILLSLYHCLTEIFDAFMYYKNIALFYLIPLVITSEHNSLFVKCISKVLFYYLPGAVRSPLPRNSFTESYSSPFSTCVLLWKMLCKFVKTR